MAINDYSSRLGTPQARSGRVQARQKTTDYRVAPVQDPRGQALAQAGQVVAGIGSDLMQQENIRMQKLQEEQARAKALSQMSDFGLRMEQSFEEARNSSPIGARNFTPDFIKKFDDESAKLAESEKDNTTRSMLREGALRLRNRFISEAITFEARQNAEAKRIELDQAVTNFSQLAYMRPTIAEDSILELQAVVDSMSFSESEKAKILQAGSQRIAASAATKMSEIMPERVVEDLSKDKLPSWAKHLDVSQIEQIKSRAERRVEQGQAVAKFSINRRYEDAIASLSTYGTAGDIPTREELIAANGEERGAYEFERLTLARQLGNDIQTLKTMSADQIESLVIERQPKPGESDFEAKQRSFSTLVSAIQNRNEHLSKDPAAYTMSAIPEVLQAHNAMLEAFSSGDEAQRSIAVQNYAMQSAAAQKRMGVESPRLLTEKLAQHYTKLLTTQPAPVNGIVDNSRSIATKVNQMRETWGSYWPEVYGEIASKVPGSVNVIASTPNEYARELLSQNLGKPSDKIFANMPAEVKPVDLVSAIDQNETFRSFVTSLGFQNGGNTISAEWKNEITRLAAIYVTQGSSLDSATEKAIDDVIGQEYEFIESDYRGGMFDRISRPVQYNLRVPKKEMPEMVRRGLGKSIEKAIVAGVKSLPDKKGMALSEQEAKERTIEIIKSSSFWIPTENEDGAILFVLDDDAIPYPVLTSGGMPVKFKWAEIRENGSGEIRQTQKADKIPQMREVKPEPEFKPRGRIF